MLVTDGEALTGLYFPDHTYPPNADSIGECVAIDDAIDEAAKDPLLLQAADELRDYLAGYRQQFDVPISPRGDEFSLAVWQHLLAIPYGQTTSYGAIARSLGRREFAQRVGQAVGHNPLCIFIPCHRVLGADGSLTGYAGGLERKRALLDLEEPEEAQLERLF